MDLVTQGVVGAAMASAAAPARESHRAALIGLGAGLLPDADALIRSAEDPLLVLEYHRHFTHALVMVPAVALVAAAVFWLILRRLPVAQPLPFGRTYGYAVLGASLAGFLDACTNYGTHLWWPFVDAPVAWSIISILDPVFTLLLLVPLGIGLVQRKRRVVRWGLALAASYLLLGTLQHQRAEAVAKELAQTRGQAVERLIVKPTIANLVLWRVLTVTDDRVYADAVRVGLGSPRTYSGTAAPLFDPKRDALHGPDAPEAPPAVQRDVQRFMRFADGVVVRHPERPQVIGDARFAMLPTRLTPLWGLAVDPDAEPAVRFVTDRSLSPEGREQFVDMLLGRPLPSNDEAP
ncbi:MAG: metal-dependent hydrolase [Bacteroidetes bacterium]|jgi:inner membrane protein|nr:metal-dependent hydrolase [Bacteroidota bacterium]